MTEHEEKLNEEARELSSRLKEISEQIQALQLEQGRLQNSQLNCLRALGRAQAAREAAAQRHYQPCEGLDHHGQMRV